MLNEVRTSMYGKELIKCFQISHFMFHGPNNSIQVWNDEDKQIHVYCWINYSFDNLKHLFGPESDTHGKHVKPFKSKKSRKARGMTHLCVHVIPDFPFHIQLCMNSTKRSTCEGKLQADDMIKKLSDDPTKAGRSSVL